MPMQMNSQKQRMTGFLFGGERGVFFLRDPQGVVWLPLFSWNSINSLECNEPLPTQPLPSTPTKSINTDVAHDVILVTSRLPEVWTYLKLALHVYHVEGSETMFRHLFLLPSSRMSLYSVRPLQLPMHIELYVRPLTDVSLIQGQPPPPHWHCNIQGLVAAHLPSVTLPIWPYAGIPAPRLFRLPTILGTEGFCIPSVFCVPSVRRRRQGCGKICSTVFLKQRALASIIPGRERFSWNLSF